MTLMVAILVAAGVAGPFERFETGDAFDAEAKANCAQVVREVQVDVRGDGAPVVFQLLGCSAMHPHLTKGFLVSRSAELPFVFAFEEPVYELKAVPAGKTQVLLVEQGSGRVSSFSVVGLHGGKLEFLAPPDFSKGVAPGETLDLDGAEVTVVARGLRARMSVCKGKGQCDRFAPHLQYLEALVRPDPSTGHLRLLEMSRGEWGRLYPNGGVRD